MDDSDLRNELDKHTITRCYERPLSVNTGNTLTLLAQTLGQKQVWIGDDDEAWLAMVYGCTPMPLS